MSSPEDPIDITSYSRYAARMLASRPALAEALPTLAEHPVDACWLARRFEAITGATLTALMPPTPPTSPEQPPGVPGLDEAGLARALRVLRAEAICTVMQRDLDGRAELSEVTEAMTALAEFAVQAGIAVLSRELEAIHGVPRNAEGERQTLGVVGMGKLGGRELNVSSDIDLIFLYEDDGDTCAPDGADAAKASRIRPLSNHEFFTKLGRKLIGLISELTPDGYVFRVDMRLRPNGDSGPLVCSLPMLEEYFYVQGREWERYAWIKGRLVSEVASEPGKRIERLLASLVQPFVFRRYLDYGVIGAIRALHEQIRHEAERRARAKPARINDIKLGRGGIREVEFSAQVFQLIRGGQEPELRVRPTLAVLGVAARRGWLAQHVADQLSHAYVFLRKLEHRIQYLDDAQTHILPAPGDDRLAVARAMGFADEATFMTVLDEHREFVAAQFDEIFADKANGNGQKGGRASTGAGDCECPPELWSECLADEAQTGDLGNQLTRLGFTDAEGALERLRAVWTSSRYKALGEQSRRRFDQLVQRAVEGAAGTGEADAVLARMLGLLSSISRRSSYLALLTEYPRALERVVKVLAGSRWAAGYLISHPQLLDELLDDEALAAPFDWPAFKTQLLLSLNAAGAAGNVEVQMDILRRAHHAEVFRILLLDLQGALSVEAIGDRLSELADIIVDVTISTVWPHVATRHREVPRFSVIAYGKLGGKELGYASDLDLIFLYDDDDERAPDAYAALARRFVTWLTTHTGAGMLFDVDLRLRPNGLSGLLVTNIQSFRQYQFREGNANTAWVWEHQALTRARFCAGDEAIGAAFESIRAQVLATPREAGPLAQEIVAMRRKVLEGHPNPTALFDLKHDRGGMVDIEFTVQYLVLLHSGAHPALLRNAGNIALLREAAQLGLIDAKLAEDAAAAYRTYRKRQHKLRLDGVEAARVPADQVAAERDAVVALWDSVFADAGPV
ncbi:bifunctional [glutamate--ammonia ligase]-adenylyl-L-tyrosine phosphorylase/[glutamate--ammonia-ligase] adenylyltransferase [Pandoraea nosoerga]|uniref:Bifunctional glutamine synthetase adenylyltransferase/adenylyl-removing enzyme n=1 Tax=Pandoraea nosoerga TaxID=2508296 RepID=A0A5E4WUK0_9BURK|nr:bifunctional [glutamate--ammonia ligase]-adenylyl-L-tyrosine phosphorylase/[glutamate--ammonia-ligase] adenylyltransferase [Pandoraea nosoerga]MBN4665582.1 bifunctional [glutamate--ammonia ligase]-adenylyl-L-tyrosine phosphorylase/[glutamate--ammonia-ligase] adenylyltransferase [Pandoraea nosoerga]MBN4675893.1 bifunctional [glutamate--ammonia ligase]-adenylyl-L-tyrosine phosphorylase/[glutamate--ammonia-ligase] adenylyltransferase [Pandoraea nosoerga]MBN4680899.1 bifunctional [glutamate--ammo